MCAFLVMIKHVRPLFGIEWIISYSKSTNSVIISVFVIFCSISNTHPMLCNNRFQLKRFVQNKSWNLRLNVTDFCCCIVYTSTKSLLVDCRSLDAKRALLHWTSVKFTSVNDLLIKCIHAQKIRRQRRWRREKNTKNKWKKMPYGR